MRILIAHNYYQQPGGEDQSFAAESLLLESHGHRMIRYTVHNDQIKDMNPLILAARTIWNRYTTLNLKKLICQENPNIVHLQNTFPIISPAAYYAVKAHGIPVVQTLRNYRLLCPNALLFRDGLVCEDCIRKFIPWPGIVHSCYRKSLAATGVIVAMLTLHRLMRTYSRMVDCYITLTEFARKKFIEGGIPAEKIVVKPNFIYPDPGIKENSGSYAIFIGRLSAEKGLRTLLETWETLQGIRLKLVGDGPLMGEIRSSVEKESLKWIKVLGQRSQEDVFPLMKGARFLVFPSECYEGFPVTICEAFACGTPVIASNLGAMAEIVEDKKTGLLFAPGNPEELATKIEWAWSHEKEMEEMGREARREFEEKYTAERNYEMLMEIYKKAVKIRKGEFTETYNQYS